MTSVPIPDDAVEALARVLALAEDWESKGEADIAFSKTVAEEYASLEFLTHGSDLVENARHLRNAIAGRKDPS